MPEKFAIPIAKRKDSRATRLGAQSLKRPSMHRASIIDADFEKPCGKINSKTLGWEGSAIAEAFSIGSFISCMGA